MEESAVLRLRLRTLPDMPPLAPGTPIPTPCGSSLPSLAASAPRGSTFQRPRNRAGSQSEPRGPWRRGQERFAYFKKMDLKDDDKIIIIIIIVIRKATKLLDTCHVLHICIFSSLAIMMILSNLETTFDDKPSHLSLLAWGSKGDFTSRDTGLRDFEHFAQGPAESIFLSPGLVLSKARDVPLCSIVSSTGIKRVKKRQRLRGDCHWAARWGSSHCSDSYICLRAWRILEGASQHCSHMGNHSQLS